MSTPTTTSELAAQCRRTADDYTAVLEAFDEHQPEMVKEIASLREAADRLEAQDAALDRIRELGTLYVHPKEWNYLKMDGAPTIEDCDKLDLQQLADIT